jgi:nucleoside-diphosphate-sugar epimerase
MDGEQRLFCFGLGYCARRLADLVAGAGWTVGGTRRGAAEPSTVPFDRARGLAHSALDGATHLLMSIPPDEQGDPVIDHVGAQIVAHAPELRWIGYLSTTGVYGDHQGAWVDESTPTAPTSERARRRVAAEQAWLDFGADHALPVHLFRLAGIYGPGRSVLDGMREGTVLPAIHKPGHVFSRIHVDDVARVLMASIARPRAGAIYNVCDDEAAAPEDVLAYACGLAGLPVPPPIAFEQATLSPMAQSFWRDNKRVSNRRLHEELAVSLAYPSYREGLAAIWAAMVAERTAPA